MAVACEPDEPLDEAGMMVAGGGNSDASTPANARDAASTPTTDDAGVVTPGNAGGGNAGGGNAGGGNASGGNAGGGDASGGTTDLDAGAAPNNRDASTSGIMVGPSVRRDGGPPGRWDPDAAGPILSAQAQAACLTLVQNICTRVADCQVMTGLPASRRALALESCSNTLLRAHNCNRAVATASGFAACSETTKTRDCSSVFGSDVSLSCADQITFQP